MVDEMDFEVRARVIRGRPPPRGEFLQLPHGRKLVGEDFSGKRFAALSGFASRLESCRFDGARIKNAAFGGGRQMSDYIDCIFDRARIEFAPGGWARFERCSFRNVDLRDWFCFEAELIDCVFTGRLKRAFFNGTVREEMQLHLKRSRNEFRDNDFSGMELIDVEFRTGIDLTLQRLPSSSDYLYLANAESAVSEVRRSVLDWPDTQQRKDAIALIGTFEWVVAGGQRQLFLRPKDFLRGRANAERRVMDLLREHSSPPPR